MAASLTAAVVRLLSSMASSYVGGWSRVGAVGVSGGPRALTVDMGAVLGVDGEEDSRARFFFQ